MNINKKFFHLGYNGNKIKIKNIQELTFYSYGEKLKELHTELIELNPDNIESVAHDLDYILGELELVTDLDLLISILDLFLMIIEKDLEHIKEVK